jgi:hypothetical protein
MILRYFISFFIFASMIFCLVARFEMFPFAPYTMYSNLYLPQYQRVLSIFFITQSNETVDMTDQMIAPFDEARFKHALMSVYFNSNHQNKTLNHPIIKSRSLEVLRITQKNTGIAFKGIELVLDTYKDLNDLRENRKTNLEKVSFYEN